MSVMGDVAVLGCGPAGLLAAYAAEEWGFSVDIYSLKKRSFISGAQYLHRAIPDLTRDESDGKVIFMKVGTPEVYAKKVYQDPNADTSWLHYPEGEIDIWSMQSVYDNLWARYQDRIEDTEIDSEVVEEVLMDGYELVVSSIDARSLCYDNTHKFELRKVIIAPYEHAKGGHDFILMNGAPTDDWYRRSVIFGHGSTEHPFEPDMHSLPGEVIIAKPVSTTCDCWLDIMRVGRYGKWTKGVLAHEAWEDADTCCALIVQG